MPDAFRHHTFAIRALLIVCASTALGALSSCNIAAPVAYLITGPGKQPAAFELDSSRSYVVFVDDRANHMPRRSLRTIMSTEAEQVLIEKRVVPQENMIASASAMRAAMAERYGEPMTIAAIGRAVGADIVIYVTIDGWTLSRDGASFSPAVGGRVKLIDAAAGERVWPGNESGYPLTVKLPTTSEQFPSGRTERKLAEDSLARAAGLRLARVFFAHEKDALSGSLDD